MLVATGYDADDQLVPLAFALVDTERNKTWENFMRFVRREVVKTRRVTVLTDRHASILRVFNERNLGWSERDEECYLRYCSRHLCQNFTKEFKNKILTGYLRGAICMNQKRKFRNKLGKIASKCPAALEWIDDIGRDPLDTRKENPPRYDLWALAFDQGGRRFGMMTTNGPESLNNVFKEARELPVTSLVEITFYKCVKYFAERRAKAEKAVEERLRFSPKIQALLEKRRLRGNQHSVQPYRNEDKYEVVTGQRWEGQKLKGGRKHTVQIVAPPGMCTCQKPQLTGIPCSHVLACCAQSGINSNGYVAPYYRAEELMKSWAPEFEPFGNSDTWPEYSRPKLVPDPTLYIVKKGRRQHIRIHNDMDQMNTQRHKYMCSLCHQSGHSRRTCTAPINNEGN